MKMNLSELVTTTLRARTKELADNMSRNNTVLLHLSWEEVNKITVPEFIEGRAKGHMMMKNGKIYRKVTYESVINRS